jgi:hypothetical protein
MTTPYTTGTVSLTNGSAVITGVGTAWQAALIAGGTVYVEADGNPMPILTVDSETQITAAIKWTGATGTYAYAIMRDTAYGQQTVANAQALATYIQRLDNAALAALAALTPGADKLAFFTGAGAAALTNLSAFARTLLDDANAAAFYQTLGEVPSAQLPARLRPTTVAATNLDLLVENGFYSVGATATNIPEGGQGTVIVANVGGTSVVSQMYIRGSNGNVWTRTLQAGAWSSWDRLVGYENIVGSVTQSGGAPTGAIIERGSNANGEYVRFADGTQIITRSGDFVFNDTVTLRCPWTFPVVFSADPILFMAGQAAGANYINISPADLSGYLRYGGGNASNTVYITRCTGAAWAAGAAMNNVRLCGIGRWF